MVFHQPTGLGQETKDICKRLGNLSKSEFCAVKVLSTRCIYGKEIRVDSVSRVDSFGRADKIELSDIKKGDTIRLGATVSNMLGGPEQTGMLTIKDIKDAQFDQKTGELIIEGSEYCLTNIDCRKDMQILNSVISDPNNWVTKEALVELTQNLTFGEYEFAKEVMRGEPTLTLNHSLDDLISNRSNNAFGDWDMDDVFKSGSSGTSKSTIETPELLF
jgi:hypothetical protein